MQSAWHVRGGHIRNMPDVCKKSPVLPTCKWNNSASEASWHHRIAKARLTAAARQSQVSACSQQAVCQVYKQTARRCQRYPQKWLSTLSAISQIISDVRNSLSWLSFTPMWNVIALFNSYRCLTSWLECIKHIIGFPEFARCLPPGSH